MPKQKCHVLDENLLLFNDFAEKQMHFSLGNNEKQPNNSQVQAWHV